MPGDADAIVVGSGPNGLAAAVTLAAAGLRVHVIEGAASPGGGCRTEELTLPGFRHDVCSAAHPLALASPFFRRFDPAARGVRFAHPEVVYAHPLDGGRGRRGHPFGAGHGGAPRQGRGRVPAADAAACRRGQRGRRRGPVIDAPAAAPLRRARRLRPAGPAFRGGGGPALCHRGSPWPVRRRRRTRDAAADGAAHGGCGAAARLAGAHGRLAGGGGRQCPAHRCHGRGHRRQRGPGGDRPMGAVPGRPAARARDAAGHLPARLPQPGGRPAAVPVP